MKYRVVLFTVELVGLSESDEPGKSRWSTTLHLPNWIIVCLLLHAASSFIDPK